MAFGHLPNRRRRRRRTSLCKISFDARDRIVELRNVDQGISLLHLLGTTTTMFRFLPRIIVGPIFFTRVDFKKKRKGKLELAHLQFRDFNDGRHFKILSQGWSPSPLSSRIESWTRILKVKVEDERFERRFDRIAEISKSNWVQKNSTIPFRSKPFGKKKILANSTDW